MVTICPFHAMSAWVDQGVTKVSIGSKSGMNVSFVCLLALISSDETTVNVLLAWDELAVRIFFGVGQNAFYSSYGFFAQNVFDFLCIVMNVIRGIAGFVCKV